MFFIKAYYDDGFENDRESVCTSVQLLRSQFPLKSLSVERLIGHTRFGAFVIVIRTAGFCRCNKLSRFSAIGDHVSSVVLITFHT